MADTTDEDLLRRAVTTATNTTHTSFPRWSVVRDIFAVGAGTAQGLCHRFGVDPDEILKGQPVVCQRCCEGEFDAEGACPVCDPPEDDA